MFDRQEYPVYLFTGFLESGKTSFINETLSDPKFYKDGDRTLLLLCEEGEEEYDMDILKENIVISILHT